MVRFQGPAKLTQEKSPAFRRGLPYSRVARTSDWVAAAGRASAARRPAAAADLASAQGSGSAGQDSDWDCSFGSPLLSVARDNLVRRSRLRGNVSSMRVILCRRFVAAQTSGTD